jgi:hypothetical protein
VVHVAVSLGEWLPTFRGNLVLSSSEDSRSFKRSLKTSGPLKIKVLRFFEKSETTHPKTQRQTPEELDPHKRKRQNSQGLQIQNMGGLRPLVSNAIEKVN